MSSKIVVFGGAFNPPTNAHFSLAEQIVSEYDEVEKVLFLPVSDQYPKEDLLRARYRIEMLRRVCEKNMYFDVCTLESKAHVLLDTIESLKILQEDYANYDIWLTMGTDNLRALPTWPRYTEILTEFKVLVLERDEDTLEQVIEGVEALKPYTQQLIKVKETVKSNCNSTLLRSKIRRGKSIRYLVPDEVYEYVESRGLYTRIEAKHIKD